MTDVKKEEKHIDQPTGVETTGHEWDGIRELNNPLPRWWLWTFYASIVFAIGYAIWYPSIPMVEGSTMGLSGQTNRLELKQEMETVDASRRDRLAALGQSDFQTIRTDEELTRFAVAGGSSIYKVYCTQCHGTGAAGGPGYPNLNDDDWLWGGDIETIYTTIKHGVRNGVDDEARDSVMPAFGADGILDKQQIASVTEFVLALSNQEHDAAKAAIGAPLFAEQCSSCHGEKGLGIRDVGAPNLADAISLYGNTRETIIAQLNRPKMGVMPPWGDKLSDANIKQLALYVHSLGGGEKSTPEQ